MSCSPSVSISRPEDLRVEVLRPRDVLGEEGHEIDALDVHQGMVPSGYGA